MNSSHSIEMPLATSMNLGHQPDGLLQFLSPITTQSFHFQKFAFDTSDLRLNRKANIEIARTTSEPKVNFSDEELTQLKKVDPSLAISKHIHLLLELFQHTAFSYFRVRVEYIDHDQCTLFHTDNVKLRLVQTLWGQSTQVIESKYVNFEGIGKGRNDLIVKDKTKIETVPKDHFILMKGSRWSPGYKGCVHKSPEIEIHNENRLLIVIDFDDEPLRDYSGSCAM